MSGIFDRLKDIAGDYVEFSEDAEAQPEKPGAPPAAAPQAAGTAAPARVAAPPMAAPSAAAPGEVDATLAEKLKQATEEARNPAYGHFRVLLSALSMVGDPATRYQAALNAASATHGVSAKAVIEALDERLTILEAERTRFQAALDAQTETDVGGAQRDVEAMRGEIERKQKEIAALEAKAKQREAEVGASRARLAETLARFQAAHAAVQAEITGERERILAHVAPAT
jgi:hypothetical protein